MSEESAQELVEGSTQAAVVASAFLLRENGFTEAAEFLITTARNNMSGEEYRAAIGRARAVSKEAKRSPGADN